MRQQQETQAKTENTNITSYRPPNGCTSNLRNNRVHQNLPRLYGASDNGHMGPVTSTSARVRVMMSSQERTAEESPRRRSPTRAKTKRTLVFRYGARYCKCDGDQNRGVPANFSKTVQLRNTKILFAALRVFMWGQARKAKITAHFVNLPLRIRPKKTTFFMKNLAQITVRTRYKGATRLSSFT